MVVLPINKIATEPAGDTFLIKCPLSRYIKEVALRIFSDAAVQGRPGVIVPFADYHLSLFDHFHLYSEKLIALKLNINVQALK